MTCPDKWWSIQPKEIYIQKNFQQVFIKHTCLGVFSVYSVSKPLNYIPLICERWGGVWEEEVRLSAQPQAIRLGFLSLGNLSSNIFFIPSPWFYPFILINISLPLYLTHLSFITAYSNKLLCLLCVGNYTLRINTFSQRCCCQPWRCQKKNKHDHWKLRL